MLKPHGFMFAKLALIFGLLSTGVSVAQEDNTKSGRVNDGTFSAGVTPSRMIITAKPGELVRRVLSIYNLGARPEQYRVYTNDWTFSEQGQVSFSDQLYPDSCRPWIKLERHEINVVPHTSRPRKFRFEAHVPENAKERECRFSVMIESLSDKGFDTGISDYIRLPTKGRIGAIVYLRIGKVKSQMSVGKTKTINVSGKKIPVIKVTNSGNAHGRLDSDLTGVDANGEKMIVVVESTPVMPDQSRFLSMSPSNEYANKHPNIAYPIKIKGKLYSDSRSFEINETIK